MFEVSEAEHLQSVCQITVICLLLFFFAHHLHAVNHCLTSPTRIRLLLSFTSTYPLPSPMYISSKLMSFSPNAPPCTLSSTPDTSHTQDKLQGSDRHFSTELTDLLFLDRNNISMDLISLNIHRGRDHGLPGYNDYR